MGRCIKTSYLWHFTLRGFTQVSQVLFVKWSIVVTLWIISLRTQGIGLLYQVYCSFRISPVGIAIYVFVLFSAGMLDFVSFPAVELLILIIVLGCVCVCVVSVEQFKTEI
jgi:hypothetical protein